MKKSALIITCIALTVPSLAHGVSEARKAEPGKDFFTVPGMYACSMELKAALMEEFLTPEMREHINKTRWTKGQHKLPDQLSGYRYDLNGDGSTEHFIHTGECGAKGDPNVLVIQIVEGKAEIIAAIQGSFGLIKREKDWDDIVEFNFSGPAYRAKTGMRFDGTGYKPVWRFEQADEASAPVKVPR